MVDPEPIDKPFSHKCEREAVGIGEDRVILDAHADEAGYFEKSPVAELVPGLPPVHQLPGLHPVQTAELLFVCGEPSEILVELGSERWRRDDSGDFRVKLCGGLPFGRAGDGRDSFEHGIAASRYCRIGGGIERIKGTVIIERQAAAFMVVCKAQIAGRDLVFKRPAQEGKRQGRSPVDVEMVGKLADPAPFDHAVPPIILKMRGHVIGHDVQNET